MIFYAPKRVLAEEVSTLTVLNISFLASFFFFVISKHLTIKKWSMTGFELGNSDVGNDYLVQSQ